ncbi:unnamed protein product [Durusdinium trenchii]|uniref:NADP-dependent oxidoreductase domain-containing protein n=1 Tax=Durusdinium trenchii TaxID=1381693 RepID=A0ABP0N0D1_9DINO
MATVEGTRRFVERLVRQQRLAPALATRRLGPLHCTALGFGAYRFPGEAKDQVPREILQRALSSVNVIDTSSHYVSGESEREIGKFFSAVDAREEYILCTKVGHVPRGTSPKGAVPIYQRSQQSTDDLHCIEGSFVESEVRSCLERLKMKQIDFVMLHNPEYLLSARMQEKVPIADAWDEMYGALFEAFKTLERLCDEGIISCGYGVSSNFLSCLFSVTGLPNLYESLVLDRVLDAAQAAAQAENCQSCRFQVAQLPLNAWENGAVLGREAQAEGAWRRGSTTTVGPPIGTLGTRQRMYIEWCPSLELFGRSRRGLDQGALPGLTGAEGDDRCAVHGHGTGVSQGRSLVKRGEVRSPNRRAVGRKSGAWRRGGQSRVHPSITRHGRGFDGKKLHKFQSETSVFLRTRLLSPIEAHSRPVFLSQCLLSRQALLACRGCLCLSFRLLEDLFWGT